MKDVVSEVFEYVRKLGVIVVEVVMLSMLGLFVSMCMGEVEIIEFN